MTDDRGDAGAPVPPEDPPPPPPVPRPDPVVAFDEAVDAWFDRLRGNPVADRVLYTASELGDFSLVWHLVATARGLRRGGDVAGTARIAALLGIESAVVNGGVKSLFRRTRPVSDEPRPHRLRQPRTSSFPSGHASAATVFVVVASPGDPWWPLYVALAGTVAASRIHVRIHHASDVVGGVVVGGALGLALSRWWPAGRTLPRGASRGRRVRARLGR